MRLGRVSRNTSGRPVLPTSRDAVEPENDAEAAALRAAVSRGQPIPPQAFVGSNLTEDQVAALLAEVGQSVLMDDNGNVIGDAAISGDPETGIVRVAPPADGSQRSARISNRVPQRLHDALAAFVTSGEVSQGTVYSFLDLLSRVVQRPECGLPLFYQEDGVDADPLPMHGSPEERERFLSTMNPIRSSIERILASPENERLARQGQHGRPTTPEMGTGLARRILRPARLEGESAGDYVSRFLRANPGLTTDDVGLPPTPGPITALDLSRIMGLPVSYVGPGWARPATGTVTTRESEDDERNE